MKFDDISGSTSIKNDRIDFRQFDGTTIDNK